MVRNYKRKTLHNDIQVYGEAVLSIQNGMSLRGAAKHFKISRTCLRRQLSQNKANTTENNIVASSEESNESSVSLNIDKIDIRGQGRKTIFTIEEENTLEEYLLHSSDIYYGLTSKEVRSLTFEYALKLKVDMPHNWIEKRTAGIDWFRGFMRRHNALSVRTPEATSLARATAFNPTNVALFFNHVLSIASEINYEANFIYNMDETAVTTVHRPQNVVSRKGQKQIGSITSGERGKLVTLALAVSAAGHRIPPFFIFPRRRFDSNLLLNAPTGSDGAANESGWMTANIFLSFLKHFKKYSRASTEFPVVLFLDNHESHCSIEAIEYCRTNSIHMVSFPPHCTHRLQPLDVSVFGPFKRALNAQCENWMIMIVGKPITYHVLPQLATRALEIGCNEGNIKSGFRKTGIWPLDADIFLESDFLPSSVTDRPLLLEEVVERPINEEVSLAVEDAAESLVPREVSSFDIPVNSSLAESSTSRNGNLNFSESTEADRIPSTTDSLRNVSLHETLTTLRPYPKAPQRKRGNRGRKSQKSAILTSDQFLNNAKDLREQKGIKANRVPKRRGRPPKQKSAKVVAIAHEPGCSSGISTRSANIAQIRRVYNESEESD